MMKTPASPALILQNELAELAISVAKAASHLGITRQQLYNVINGKSAISPDLALRLEKAFGSTAEMWLKLQMQHDLIKARANFSANITPIAA